VYDRRSTQRHRFEEAVMRRPSARPFVISTVALSLALAIAGCGSAAPATSRPGASGAAVSPAAAASPARQPVAGVANAMLLVARPGAAEWDVIEAISGNTLYTIPVGAPADGFTWIATATTDGDETVVADRLPEPRGAGPQVRIPGHWRFPHVGTDPIPVGRSLDGSTFVLEATTPGTKVTRFAVVENPVIGITNGSLKLVRILELPGTFDYDTLSPNGKVLYVVEHLEAAAGGRYQVRAIDLPSGVMRDGVIVDKANPEESMAGYPISQLRRSDGSVLTLYDGPEHPFIHALQSVDGYALCIDLPGKSDANRAAWGLAQGADLGTVFAVNPPAGLAVDVDPAGYAVRRWSTIETAQAPAFVLAKFGGGKLGPAGPALVVTPDGKRLLAGSSDGITVLATKDLRVQRRDLAGTKITAIALTPDGSTGFALTGDGRLLAFEVATGASLGEVGGGPWSGLLAVTAE
jgi:hypothetical protein